MRWEDWSASQAQEADTREAEDWLARRPLRVVFEEEDHPLWWRTRFPSLGWSTDTESNTLLVYEDAWFLSWQLGELDDYADPSVPARHLPPQSLARPLKVAKELGMPHEFDESLEEDELLARMSALRGRRSQAQYDLCMFGVDDWEESQEGELPALDPLFGVVLDMAQLGDAQMGYALVGELGYFLGAFLTVEDRKPGSSFYIVLTQLQRCALAKDYLSLESPASVRADSVLALFRETVPHALLELVQKLLAPRVRGYAPADLERQRLLPRLRQLLLSL